jgi:hypothetical protein
MFKVYFDGIEQREEDIININDLAEFTIIREDGFNSTEQILREKTELQLSFGGEAYCYVHDKIKNEQCAQIDFRIEDGCGLIYNGIIPVTTSELNIFEKYGKVSIKDNSFSAYIRDYLDSQIQLNFISTKNCVDVDLIIKGFKMYYTHDNNTDYYIRYGFDVLDTIKHIINYFTDDSIQVVSNYLTTNKYAITTGYNMHNGLGLPDNVYPNISLQDLFSELRKKLRLYMGIEYDINDKPYLRIEQEDYFFSNTISLLNIDIQPKTVQKYNTDRDFNYIDIGSSIYEPVDEFYNFVDDNKYDYWKEGTFQNCGTCTANKGNKLNLVSEYIISSNLIYDALNAGASDYSFDTDIFLFQYEIIAGENIGKRELISGEYVYNTSIINSEVLQNWIDYYGKCIAIERIDKGGFTFANFFYYKSFFGGSFPPLPVNGGIDNVIPLTQVFDNNSGFGYLTGSIAYPPNIYNGGGTISYPLPMYYYKSSVNKSYDFQLKIDDLMFFNVPTGVSGTFTFMAQIVVYTDNTLSSISTYHDYVINLTENTPINIDWKLLGINMNANECVSIIFSCLFSSLVTSITLQASRVVFRTANNECESIDYNNENSKPYEIEFQYPLCQEDYQLARQNKNGYIAVASNRYWIKEINYKPKRLSTLKLIGNNSL